MREFEKTNKEKQKIKKVSFEILENETPIFLGGFLLDGNKLKEELKKRGVEIAHSQKKMTHVTFSFNPSNERLKEANLGEEIEIKIKGVIEDEKGQALLLEENEVFGDKDYPHITVSVDEGVGSIYSNELIEKEKGNKIIFDEPISVKIKVGIMYYEYENKNENFDRFDLEGREEEISTVKSILEKLESGEDFYITGGGGSGKTESLLTALEVKGKSLKMFDLRKWLIKKLGNEETRKKLLEEKLLESVHNYLLKLERKIEERKKGKKTESVIKSCYFNDEELKVIEKFLLEKNKDEIIQELQNSDEDVIVFDEFDLGVENELTETERETAKIIMEIKRKIKDKRVVAIIHPAARKDEKFMEVINEEFNESEVETQFFSPQIEKYILVNKMNLSEEKAEEFMALNQGLPLPYLKFLTNEDFYKELKKIPLEEERVKALISFVQNKIDGYKRVIFDKENEEVKRVLLDLANEKPEAGRGIDRKTRNMAKRTMFVYEEGDILKMPPILKEVIKNWNL